MKLKRIKGNSYYIDGYNSIGVIVNKNDAILIDSGSDDSKAKKINKILKEEGLNLIAIINTHSHADHCGGNNYLQNEYECQIFSSRIEASLISSPEIEPFYLFGSYPINSLNNKFLKAKKSKNVNVLEYGKNEINGIGFEVIDLKGHSPEMIGIKTEDNILFLGDSIIEKETVDKHKILYLYDLKNTLNTLERLKDFKCDNYLLYHGGLYSDIKDVIEYNVSNLLDTNEKIITSLNDMKTKEDLVSELTLDLEIDLNSSLYYLNHGAISAHISYLVNKNEVKFKIKDNKMHFINNK